MKILFVRHGESVDDLEDRYGGWADFAMTEKGEAQLRDAAEKIALTEEQFAVVLSSPLKRALQAAEIVAGRLGKEVKVFEYLKERNLNGILTGMVRSEAKEKYPEQVRLHANYEYVDGSERTEDMNRRVETATKLLLTMPYDSVIAVTHGLFLRAFFKEMMHLTVKKVGDGGLPSLVKKTIRSNF